MQTYLHRQGVRDLNQLSSMRAILVKKSENKFLIATRPEWATEITESQFYQQINRLPSAKTRLVITAWD
jgi:hypothetical protein